LWQSQAELFGLDGALGVGMTRLAVSSEGYLKNSKTTLYRPVFSMGFEAGLKLGSRVDLLSSAVAALRTSDERLVVSGVEPSVVLSALRLRLLVGVRVGLW